MGWLISFVAFIVRVPHIDPLQNDPVRRVRRIMKDLCSKAVCVPRLVNSTLSPVKRTHQTINQSDCFLCLVALFRTKITFYNHPVLHQRTRTLIQRDHQCSPAGLAGREVLGPSLQNRRNLNSPPFIPNPNSYVYLFALCNLCHYLETNLVNQLEIRMAQFFASFG